MGYRYRFGIAGEAKFERFNGGGGAETVSLEARWALADWNKIPLNPTLFAEYKFGVALFDTKKHRHASWSGRRGRRRRWPAQGSRCLRISLLLAQDFGERVEWAMNWFFEKENTGDRGASGAFPRAP